MNEKTKQITGQVLDELVPNTWVSLGYDKIKEIQYRTAELIVLESSKWIVDNSSSMEQLGPEYFAMALCKHFGVK
jgi:hypothetical protein